MRRLALIIPASLLALAVILASLHRPVVPTGAVGDAEITEDAAPLAGDRGMRWVSHDWVEIDPDADAHRQDQRRQTFGLDAARAATDAVCVDSNCRACLIDFVYGREF